MTITDYFHQAVTSKPFKVTMMVLGMAAFIYILLWIFLPMIHMYDFPPFLQGMLSLLGAGLLSYKYLAPRIGA
ncbi:hypothetical protein EOL73_01570 [Candidatus Saccharibacteria bacterium]|nr:hypothetical protein [Candidatus Saccharibacteria bacterium]NCU40425.1 hypothetical protein [Candidatus Saccharibacteria bacterium]